MDSRIQPTSAFTLSPTLAALEKKYAELREELKALKAGTEEKPKPGTVAFANQHYKQFGINYLCSTNPPHPLNRISTKVTHTIDTALWNGNLIAIKTTSNALDYTKTRREINFLQTLSLLPESPAVGFLGYRYENSQYSILMEYAAKGSLLDYSRQQALTWPQQYTFIQQITSALAVLHDQQILHRHLKPEHILVWDSQLKIKFCGFGQSQKPDNTIDTYGSPLYMAPELYTAPATDKADIYSASMVFWQILSGSTNPYQGQLQNDAPVADLIAAVNTGMRPSLMMIATRKLRTILRWMWQADPAQRPTAKALQEELKTDMFTFSDNLRQVAATLESSTSLIGAALRKPPTPKSSVAIVAPRPVPSSVSKPIVEIATPGTAAKPIVTIATPGTAPKPSIATLTPGTVAFANHHYQVNLFVYRINEDDKPKLAPKPIGKGAFGTVYQATWHGHPVAVKEAEQTDTAGFYNEAYKLQVMNFQPNPPTIGFLGYRVTGTKQQLVLEYAQHGNLQNYIKQHPALDMSTRYTIMKVILNNLVVLHANNIVHDDIKPENMLVCKEQPYDIKFCDLAFSFYPDNKTTFNGTPLYMPPEKGKTAITDKSDIFSMSIVFWRIVTGMKDPYKKQTFVTPGALMLAVRKGLREEIPSYCPTKITRIINWMWQADPKNRPGAKELALEFQTDMYTLSDKLRQLK